MELSTTGDGILLHQKEYIKPVCKKMNISTPSIGSTRSFVTPMATVDLKDLTKASDDAKKRFRQIIGTLLFISGCFRPEVSFGVNYLSRFQSRSATCREHLKRSEKILGYLLETCDYGNLSALVH
jgi:hypothetical protein